MNKQSKRMAYGLLYSFLFIVACVLIKPEGLSANDGLSYFGGLKATVIPYALSFLIYGVFCWDIAKDYQDGSTKEKILAFSLRLMALLLAGLVVTPHTVANGIHTAIGAALFSFQLLLSFWLVNKILRNLAGTMLITGEFISGLGAFYYLPKPEGLLLQCQILFQLFFGILLILSLDKISLSKTRKTDNKIL